MKLMLKGLWWPLKTYMEAIDFAAENKIETVCICYTSADELSCLWRQPFSGTTLDSLEQLAHKAREQGVQLMVLINPTITSFAPFPNQYIRWRHFMNILPSNLPMDRPMDLLAPEDEAVLLNKLRDLRGVEIDAVMICFDDAGFDTPLTREAEIANRLSEQFNTVMLTPSPYWINTPRAQGLPALGSALRPNIEVFWTGPEIVSLAIYKEDEQRARQLFLRTPSLWFNYPVNDYLDAALMTQELPQSDLIHLEAPSLLINPMFQFEASKPLIRRVIKMIN